VSIFSEGACQQRGLDTSGKKYMCLIFFKIRPSLTTSKEGLKRINISETHIKLFQV
jgi:hypothetical protein